MIHEKIYGLLNEQIYKEEFSHATLHGTSIFKTYKEKHKNEKVESQINDQFVASYNPSNGQDPNEFRDNYIGFIQQVEGRNSNYNFN